jgi:hypothetical protein
MKRQSKKGHPDAFDLAWLDHEELHKLQQAMLSYRENELCAYWLHCLNEQLAIRAGKLRIMPGAEARDPRLKAISDQRSSCGPSNLPCYWNRLQSHWANRPASAFVKCWFNVAKVRCDEWAY